jgi:hypothetical protein
MTHRGAEFGVLLIIRELLESLIANGQCTQARAEIPKGTTRWRGLDHVLHAILKRTGSHHPLNGIVTPRKSVAQ